jgi:hypothetical protein
MPDDLRAVVEDTQHELTLRAWGKLVSTHAADYIEGPFAHSAQADRR